MVVAEMMVIMKLFLISIVLFLALVAPRPIFGAEAVGSIVAFAENGAGCDDSAVRFFFTYTPTTDDENGQRDWVGVGLYDASGIMLAYNAYSVATDIGGTPTPIGTFTLRFNALGNTPVTRPFFLSFRDANGATTLDNFDDLTELTRYPFDPVALGASRCDNLPYAPLGIGLEDGRVNWDANGQTVAVYCEANGNITLVAISQETGRGLYALRVTGREIVRAGVPSETPVLIKQDTREAIRLYRLSSGEFQAVAPYTDSVAGTDPNGYNFIWTGCDAPTTGVTR
jgi:hypothetical protein